MLDELASRWMEIVGPQMAQHARPVAIQGTTLIVATRSSAWSQQLGFLLEERILGEVKAAGGDIARIRSRVGLRTGVRGAASVAAHGVPHGRRERRTRGASGNAG